MIVDIYDVFENKFIITLNDVKKIYNDMIEFDNGSTLKLKNNERIEIRKWFAVMSEYYDNWDNGTYNYNEAVKMLKEQGEGYIAVIDELNMFCEEEIKFEDII